jgi:thioredoxin 1
MIGPLLDELAGIYRGRLKIAKLNVDENPRTAAAFNVSSIPTLLFVKGGKVKDIRIGASSRQALMQWIDDLLAA